MQPLVVCGKRSILEMRVVGKQFWHFDKTIISSHVESFLIDSYVDATLWPRVKSFLLFSWLIYQTRRLLDFLERKQK